MTPNNYFKNMFKKSSQNNSFLLKSSYHNEYTESIEMKHKDSSNTETNNQKLKKLNLFSKLRAKIINLTNQNKSFNFEPRTVHFNKSKSFSNSASDKGDLNNSEVEFLHNSITTSKYSSSTFLPKFLFEQFSNYANIFFAFISALQLFTGLSPTSKFTTIVPLVVVLIFTGFKELAENNKRKRSDKETNNNKTKRLDIQSSKFEEAKWSELKVGDFVKIEDDESFPADIVLISSSEPECLCYIETSNLDGETNLKIKQGLPETKHILDPKTACCFRGYIESEGPNNSLYTYEGTLCIQRENNEIQKYSLDPNQILLRGATLRNTNWIYGVVVFTGHESKLMLNSASTPIKITNLIRMTNKQISMLFGILVLLALFCSFGAFYYETFRPEEIAPYTRTKTGNIFNFVKNLVTFIILFNSIIPISLIVTIEIVKYFQAVFINSDIDMFYDKTQTASLARSSALVEELGQIKYIFSDKTGTLTCNIMEFQECSINGVAYSSKTDFTNQPKTIDGVEYGRHSLTELIDKLKIDINQNLFAYDFFTILATCHTVIPERKNSQDKIKYQAASPDEGALVEGAAKYGFEFLTRKPRSITCGLVNNEETEIEVLNICEFNSTRKRMSIILRFPDGEIRLYTKGADTVIFERLSNSENNTKILNDTIRHLEEYATIGLRTLCIAQKELDKEYYNNWNNRFNEAATSLENRQGKLDDLAEEIESNLELVGATAIEDKLQDGVPETIHTLARAGIKIWVLTGDRQETAINIGFSCKLLDDNTMDLVVVNEESIAKTKSLLEEKMHMLNKMDENNIARDIALIIDGKTLNYALDSECEDVFYHLSIRCKAVICCRVSPLQKALVVKLVKKRSKDILLAIGDGANDVSMIQTAHVGVGINGMEGLQAARSSDFAISQFKYLKKLLLVHGSWSYQRLSKLILYSFYKNITLQMTQVWFAFYNGFSGSILYESWTMTAFNILFTVFPPFAIGIFDQHLSARMLDRYPEIYQIGQKQTVFNLKTFWGYATNAIYHSILLFFLVAIASSRNDILPSGRTGGYDFMSVNMYTCVLATVLFKASLMTK